MQIKISNSDLLKKYLLIDSKGIQFGMQANKVIEERLRDSICITFFENEIIIGRFYNYSSVVLLEEKSISTKIH